MCVYDICLLSYICIWFPFGNFRFLSFTVLHTRFAPGGSLPNSCVNTCIHIYDMVFNRNGIGYAKSSTTYRLFLLTARVYARAIFLYRTIDFPCCTRLAEHIPCYVIPPYISRHIEILLPQHAIASITMCACIHIIVCNHMYVWLYHTLTEMRNVYFYFYLTAKYRTANMPLCMKVHFHK